MLPASSTATAQTPAEVGTMVSANVLVSTTATCLSPLNAATRCCPFGERSRSTAAPPSATRVTSFFIAVSNTTSSEDGGAAFRPNIRHAEGWASSLTIVPETANERGDPGATGLQAQPSSVAPLQSLSTASPQISVLGET